MRTLFSKDASGNLIRNYYCLECGLGPFTQSDIDNNILIEIGWGHQRSYLCRTCCKMKLPKIELPAVPAHCAAKQEYVESGKMGKDMENGVPPPVFEQNPVITPVKEESFQKSTEVLPEEVEIVKETVSALLISSFTEDISDPLEVDFEIDPVTPEISMLEPLAMESPITESSAVEPKVQKEFGYKEINLNGMTGKAIVNFVEVKTGNKIQVPFKRKDKILKKAKKILEEKGLKVFV